MNRYGTAAVEAANYCILCPDVSPVDAWEKVTKRLFGEGSESQKKSCPRSTFLGLCQAGRIKGISSGRYTASTKNADFAIAALMHLGSEKLVELKPLSLWKAVVGADKQHNSQMDVVIALWNAELID